MALPASWRRSITPRPRSRRRSSSRPPSSSRASCRCSRCGLEGHIFGPWPDLRIRHCRGPARHLHHLARLAACCCPTGVGDRDMGVRGLGVASTRRSAILLLAAEPSWSPASAPGVLVILAGSTRSAWNSCPSSKRATLDPRRHAGLDLARGRQRLCQPHAAPDQDLPRSPRPCHLPARPAGRRHRFDRASSTPSSSCR